MMIRWQIKILGLTALAIVPVMNANAAALPPVQTVFVIVFENRNWSTIHGSTNAPYINNVLLPMASYCEQYYNPPGKHPSLLNYLWLEAGTDFGITVGADPSINHQSTTNHLVSLLNRANISWKTYQEDIDGNYIPLTGTNNYAVRHNPFVYFDDVTGANNPNYAYGIQHVRPYGELAVDLTNNTVASYNFITPNLCDDGHDVCGPLNNALLQSDTWLAAEVPKILNSAAYSNNGALFITWDEGIGGTDGPIGMILLSPLARGGGYFNNIHYTHSSALRTFQEMFAVTPLLNDATNADDLSDLFISLDITRVNRLTNGCIQLDVAGALPGSTNYVQTSTDLFQWTFMSTNIAVSNTFIVEDFSATNFATRFYRVVSP